MKYFQLRQVSLALPLPESRAELGQIAPEWAKEGSCAIASGGTQTSAFDEGFLRARAECRIWGAYSVLLDWDKGGGQNFGPRKGQGIYAPLSGGRTWIETALFGLIPTTNYELDPAAIWNFRISHQVLTGALTAALHEDRTLTETELQNLSQKIWNNTRYIAPGDRADYQKTGDPAELLYIGVKAAWEGDYQGWANVVGILSGAYTERSAMWPTPQKVMEEHISHQQELIVEELLPRYEQALAEGDPTGPSADHDREMIQHYVEFLSKTADVPYVSSGDLQAGIAALRGVQKELETVSLPPGETSEELETVKQTISALEAPSEGLPNVGGEAWAVGAEAAVKPEEPTDWTKVALVGGGAFFVLILLVVLLKR